MFSVLVVLGVLPDVPTDDITEYIKNIPKRQKIKKNGKVMDVCAPSPVYCKKKQRSVFEFQCMDFLLD